MLTFFWVVHCVIFPQMEVTGTILLCLRCVLCCEPATHSGVQYTIRARESYSWGTTSVISSLECIHSLPYTEKLWKTSSSVYPEINMDEWEIIFPLLVIFYRYSLLHSLTSVAFGESFLLYVRVNSSYLSKVLVWYIGRMLILTSVGLVHKNMRPREIIYIVHMMPVTQVCISRYTLCKKTGIE